jgi:hypothetical protein
MARRCGIMVLLVAVAVIAQPTLGASISIPNYSFESPTTTFVNTNIDSWSKTPQPAWWTSAYGYDWSQLTGLFVNTAPGASDHIDNMDQNQAIWLFAVPGAGLYQDLAGTYTVGQAYTLTAGVLSGPILDSNTMQIGLYYRDVSNAIVPLGAATATAGTVADNNGTHLEDYSFVLPAVSASDPWAGKAIGVQLLATATFENMGGYWDADNVRLTTTPEPATMALLAAGAGFLASRRRRTASR